MFRNAVARPLLRANQRLVATRSFSVASVRMGAGDTGAPRGAAAADSFTKREAAQENLYVREKELEKLKELKSKLKEQRKHLDELDKHIDQLTKEQGGEQN
ncbi:ATPase inhibitor [Talaromyces marneffei ATCC 18224]|uniref:ATPase inhibitor, mitochondrial n=2 Tax=Talaromyces marneffei TaxID=37727 RepID=B6QL29_TALMQ|nr:uncharacterized protein EYB26_008091 [Talaromyces marneffei]EEA21806.1 ATPase inhibitor, mitochondrial precursor, putative [Talaromyces marneffei ATCC 18224]KAE8550722.1 hypothetical protein EYB25_006950 [Talaromyces marneffei]QGA20389.1 hypothetical protein EYB26_008091 [Talaromyces marneffei]